MLIERKQKGKLGGAGGIRTPKPIDSTQLIDSNTRQNGQISGIEVHGGYTIQADSTLVRRAPACRRRLDRSQFGTRKK